MVMISISKRQKNQINIHADGVVGEGYCKFDQCSTKGYKINFLVTYYYAEKFEQTNLCDLIYINYHPQKHSRETRDELARTRPLYDHAYKHMYS